MSAYNLLAEKAADSTDSKTAFPAGTIRLGVDGEGGTHYVSRIEDIVFVVTPEQTIELQESIEGRTLDDWIDYVAVERGWDTLQYADSLGEALALEVA